MTAAAALLDVPVHRAAAADEKVTVGATVFNLERKSSCFIRVGTLDSVVSKISPHLSVNSIDVLLKLMVQWKPSTTYVASQGLYSVCGVFSGL